MNFSKEKMRDFYLLTTEVENLFINEYMSDAPGEYVKVYLFGLLYGQHETEMSHQLLLKQLKLTEKDLKDAWDYWEKKGVIRKIPNKEEGVFNYDVEYINLREKMYGYIISSPKSDDIAAVVKTEENEKDKEENDINDINDIPLVNNDLKGIYDYIEEKTGELLPSLYMNQISDWVSKYGISVDVIMAAVRHCYELGKKNFNYLTRVVVDWHERGFKTKEECEAYVENHQEQQEKYKKVLQSLGQYRPPTEAEKKYMRKWFDEMNFSVEKVIEACDQTAAISNPSIKYVDKILENWYNESVKSGNDVNQKKTVNMAVLNKYYDALRDKEEREARERRDNLYKVLPRVKEIDLKINDISAEMAKGLFTGLSKENVDCMKRKRMELDKERAVLLTENNFRVDHTDVKYRCDVCKDTGTTKDGQRCDCTEQRMREAELWQVKKLEI